MKIKLLSPVQHDGKDYAEGDTVDMKDEQGAALIACGAAEAAEAARGRKAKDESAE